MSRRTIRLAVAGSAVAATVLAGGTAFAADAPGYFGGGGGNGGVGGSGGNGGVGGNGGLGNNGGNGGSGLSSVGGSEVSSNGGTVTSGGGASTTSSSGSNLPFTGLELATVLTLGVGAIGAGSVVVVASRRKRGTSAVA